MAALYRLPSLQTQWLNFSAGAYHYLRVSETRTEELREAGASILYDLRMSLEPPSSLLMACQWGVLPWAQFAIQQISAWKTFKARLNRPDKVGFGNKPLVVASSRGHLPIVRLLLESGYKDTGKSSGLTSALCAAALEGHTEIVRSLLEDDPASISQRTLGWTSLTGSLLSQALCCASYAGNKETIMLLLNNGANVNSKPQVGYLLRPLVTVEMMMHFQPPPLAVATSSGNDAVIPTLLDHGADVNCTQFGKTVLLHAIPRCSLASVLRILQHAPDISARDFKDETAMFKAAARGDEAICSLLLEYGADFNAVSAGYSMLHAAAKSDSLTVGSMLIACGVDFVAMSGSGNPLHTAVYYGHCDFVKLLLGAGSPVDCTGRRSSRYWEIEPVTGHVTRKKLSDVKSEPDYDSNALDSDRDERVEKIVWQPLDGRLVSYTQSQISEVPTPLRIAMAWGHFDIARHLIASGADVHTLDAAGETLLHELVRLKKYLLIQPGDPDPDAKNDRNAGHCIAIALGLRCFPKHKEQKIGNRTGSGAAL